ncbi:hypothetical protein F3Y22_tig00111213pilonHSYRG00292 [Hibiscus syriacus]|uniref:Reverse transcriptase zinc-binding domain-containing protein n=1 Tax=Hibiscus syriacus TaxID=106335 RepID=A0A6A2YUW2_HIBSY|nr:hypothetical protein F3Y22_tig00111213pilonHSYRG00292 [Hibiscus syriacus]
MVGNFIWGSTSSRTIHWVSWKCIVKPKEFGGLGFFDVNIHNRSLLNKWSWRYGLEPNSMWRRVIDAKMDGNPRVILPVSTHQRNVSWIWRNISRPVQNREDVFTHNLRFILGDGGSIDFWNDPWASSRPLKEVFLRIYAHFLLKEGKVNEFGLKENGVWDKFIRLRRPLFDWERDYWLNFLNVISSVTNHSASSDCLKWEGNSSGLYTPKTLCEKVSCDRSSPDSLWKLVWTGLAPPKVDFFTIRSGLRKPGITESDLIRCVLCDSCDETVDHLLFHCKVSWNIW